MTLKFVKSHSDIRGTILFYSYGSLSINFIETKQNFSRGGHFHDFKSIHLLLSGKIEFRTIDTITKKEEINIFSAPFIIPVGANVPHLLTALKDSLFLECFEKPYFAMDYSPYRKIINDQLSNHIDTV